MNINIVPFVYLIASQIMGGPGIQGRVNEISVIKSGLQPQEVLMLEQSCGTHPFIYASTNISFGHVGDRKVIPEEELVSNSHKNSNDLDTIYIGNNYSLPCSQLKVAEIKGYYIQSPKNGIILRKYWGELKVEKKGRVRIQLRDKSISK